MATLEEVKKEAGMLLGIVAEQDSLRAEDDSLLNRTYNQIYDELDNEGIAEWSQSGEIPDRVMPHVAALMAFSAAPKKSISEPKYNRILALRNVAKPEIRRLIIPKTQSVQKPVDY